MGKLHEQMEEDLILKAYSPHTPRAYRRAARHYLRSPQEMGEKKIRGFLRHPARDRKASPANSSSLDTLSHMVAPRTVCFRRRSRGRTHKGAGAGAPDPARASACIQSRSQSHLG